MRIDTAEKRAAYRAMMIPKGSTPDSRSGPDGAVYLYELAGKVYAMAFRGSAGKPEWHYSFKDASRREVNVAEFFLSVAGHVERTAKRRAEATSFVHDCKIGDIFRASWGYDQTNIDYYQITALIGKHMAEVREICQQSEDTAWLQGDCVPSPGQWATEADYSEAGQAYKAEHGAFQRIAKKPRRMKIQGSFGGEPCLKIESFCHAYRIKPIAEVAGAKVFASSHWTAYA